MPADASGCRAAHDPKVSQVETCGTTVYATEQQVGRTPRSDPNLELMVIDELGTVVAPNCVYSRVARDIQRIRRKFADGRIHNPDEPVRYWRDHDGRTLWLHFDEETGRAVEAGEYEAWDCLNAHYEKTEVEARSSVARLKLEGTYDLERVAESYRGLPGLEPNAREPVEPARPRGGFEARRSHICFEIEGGVYHYVLVERWGDCESGCIYDGGRYFTTTRAGDIRKRGEYNEETDGRPAPEWTNICEKVEF